jgi:hypothetical protein
MTASAQQRGELARDGERDHGAAFAAPLELLPAPVQPPARPLRLGAHRCRLALAAARELAALAQRAALMPGRLDQQPPCVRVGGLGDGALVAPLTTR